MKLKNLLIVAVLLIVGIWLYRDYNKSKCVEDLVVVPETVYVETTERETIRIEIDSIKRVLDYRTVNEDKLYETINDTDSIALVNLFYELVTGKRPADTNGGDGR